MPHPDEDMPGPMELLDLEHEESIVLRIDRYELGSTLIHPRAPTARHIRMHMTQYGLPGVPAPGTPISVRVPVLRVWGDRLDAASASPYWDITSQTLIASLAPRLYAAAPAALTVRLTAHGQRPSKRYAVEVLP